MTRKSKQSGGNYPLTHYEMTKKFASSEYGTISKRLAGHSQYQLGDCALSLTQLQDTALCSPSGYLYSEDAIVEYLLTKTQEIKEQKEMFQVQERLKQVDQEKEEQAKRVTDFEDAQKVGKKRKVQDSRKSAQADLKRTSYWIAESQPDQVDKEVKPPPERPVSPHSQTPLRRKDLWPVALVWQDKKLVCSVSDKPLNDAIAYWTDKKQPGHLVQTALYDELVKDVCPHSGRRVKFKRALQKSGTSFAASGQQVVVKKYAPTIT